MNKTTKILYLPLMLSITLGIATLKAEEPATPKNILVQDANFSITKQEALIMLEDMSPIQRTRLLSNLEKFQHLMVDFLIVKKKVAEAKKLKIDQQKLSQWKIEKATNRILADQLIAQHRQKIVVPDDIKLLAKEYYDTHPEEFLVEEKIKVAHILLSTKDITEKEAKAAIRKKLQTIIEQIKTGEITFEEAAEKHSSDTGSAKSGGVINFFTRGKMVKPFETAAFNLKKKNEISAIVSSQFGFHVIKLLDRTEKSTQPYSKAKEQLIRREEAKYIQSKSDAYNDTFKVNKNTVIFQKEIQDLISNAKATPKK